VGVLVTLDLADDSPIVGLPWIITFGPNSDEAEWEPVVVGPYERVHAIALAEEIVADEELMAVVEPLLPFTSTDEIRNAIATAIAAADEEEDADEDTDYAAELDLEDVDLDLEEEEEGEEAEGLADEEVEVDEEVVQASLTVPSPAEVKAGMARIAAKLAATE
jgi:hypothetical protein